jgi:hypothetical protein
MRLQIHSSVPLHIVDGNKYLLYNYIALKKEGIFSAKFSRLHILGHKRRWRYYGSPSRSTGVCHVFLMVVGNVVTFVE